MTPLDFLQARVTLNAALMDAVRAASRGITADDRPLAEAIIREELERGGPDAEARATQRIVAYRQADVALMRLLEVLAAYLAGEVDAIGKVVEGEIARTIAEPVPLAPLLARQPGEAFSAPTAGEAIAAAEASIGRPQA